MNKQYVRQAQYRKGFIVPLIIIVVLIAGGIYFIHKHFARHNAQVSSEQNNNQNMNSTITYVNQKAGYQIDYPKDFVPKYTNIDRAIGPDVSFAFPESFTKGTNLSTDSAIKVETIQGATCTELDFFKGEDPKAVQLYSIDSPNFSSKGQSIGAAAGNRYEKIVYSELDAGKCYGVQLFLHSSNIGNYPAGTVKEFDRKKIDDVFNPMLLSFKLERNNQ